MGESITTDPPYKNGDTAGPENLSESTKTTIPIIDPKDLRSLVDLIIGAGVPVLVNFRQFSEVFFF